MSSITTLDGGGNNTGGGATAATPRGEFHGKDAARFSAFINQSDPDQCWEWQSTRGPRGYGKFWLDGRTQFAHRVSYRLHKGSIPEGFVVRHTCDNPPCVNPAHLLIGTLKDNARDAIERGLYPRGSANGRAKLSAEQVSEVRRGWANGETQVAMAKRFCVSRSAIQWVLNGRNWAGIGEDGQ